MTAMLGSRIARKRVGQAHSRLVAANAKIWSGALVVLNAAGYAQPGSTALNLLADGVATNNPADNTGGPDGAIRVDVEPGNFEFFNSAAGDAIGLADIGKTAWIVDDQTVAKTNGGGTRSAAGPILAVSLTTGMVWVAVGIAHL